MSATSPYPTTIAPELGQAFAAVVMAAPRRGPDSPSRGINSAKAVAGKDGTYQKKK